MHTLQQLYLQTCIWGSHPLECVARKTKHMICKLNVNFKARVFFYVLYYTTAPNSLNNFMYPVTEHNLSASLF